MYSLSIACACFSLVAAAVGSAQDPLAPMREVVANRREAVVHVYVRIAKAKDQFGKDWFKDESDKRSGVILDPSGLVLTHWTLAAEAYDAAHELRAGHSIEVRLKNGRTYGAALLARDEGADLALLQLTLPPGTELPWFELGDSATAAPGRLVATIGMPDDAEEVVFVGALSQAVGELELGTRALGSHEILLSDASIRPENRAGAFVDSTGRLLGLCHSKFFVPPKAEPVPESTPELSFGVAVGANVIRAAFAAEFANPGLRNQTLRAAPTAAEGAQPSATERAVARVADAIVSVRAAGDDALDGESADQPDPYAERRHRGVGSGVVVDSSGLVLTNAHLVANSKEIVVTRRDGKRFDAAVIATDPKLDVALLRIEGSGHGEFTFAELGRSADVARGEQILAIGNSRGSALSVGVGVLSSANRAARVGGAWWATAGLLQVDAPVHPGNSGGALVDLTGRVIGILNAGESDARAGLREAKMDTNIGFAVPVDAIRAEFRDAFDRHTARNRTLSAAPTSSAAERELRSSDVTALAERLAPSLVSVYVAVEVARAESFDPFADADRTTETRGLGSGVIIEPNGLALTNWHVIENADDVMVETGDGQSYKARVLSSSRIDDLALLQLELPDGATVPAVEMGDSGALPIGSTVVAIGNPYGHANTVTVGVVSAKNQAIHVQGRARMFEGLLQTDAAINPGNSGGALLDLQGRLVGINSAGSTAEAEVGYAIPVDHAREKFESELLSAEKLGVSYLGLVVVDEDGGAVVRTIDPHGPAARAGFEVGDVVAAVEATAVGSRIDFVRNTLAAPADRPLAITVRREGARLVLEPKPISGAAWRVFRQTGVEVETMDAVSDAALIRAAHLALHRHFTGDGTGSPAQIPTTAVRVVRLHPLEVEKGLKLEAGDLLLGIEVSQRQAFGGVRSRLEPFDTVGAISQTFDRYATKEGLTRKLLVVRDGEVREVQVGIRRVE